MFFTNFFCIFAQKKIRIIMIKRIFHISDVHIHNFHRLEEYSEQLAKLKNMLIENSKGFEKDEIRIVISGDIAHSKNNISNELITFVSTWIRELEEIARVIVISGNHDLLVGNDSRIDTLTAIFTTAGFKNAIHLDSYLGYDSGVIVDDNVVWALYSIFTDFRRPNIEETRKAYPDNTIIGLYHGTIIGSTLNNGTVMENGTDGDIFKGCDMVMAGDIHKRQVIKRGDVEIVYPGSLIQQTFGETVTQHGFVVWDLENKTREFIDIPTEYGLYDFEIKSPEDIDNDKEIIINY